MTTAEWQCSKCGTINRKLVPNGANQAKDRCMSCGQRCTILRGSRPVRWEAKTTP